MIYQDGQGLLDLPYPNLAGGHQIINAGCALQTLRLLDNGLIKNFDSVTTNASWPARMQKLKDGLLNKLYPSAEIWLDGGHNAAAGEAIAAHLSKLKPRPTYAICGMLNTKDIKGFMNPLSSQIDKLFGISIPEENNTLSGHETSQEAANVGMVSNSCDSLESAFKLIKQHSENPRIIICGSLYLAGHVLALQKYEIN